MFQAKATATSGVNNIYVLFAYVCLRGKHGPMCDKEFPCVKERAYVVCEIVVCVTKYDARKRKM
jgi:hypothetical protein